MKSVFRKSFDRIVLIAFIAFIAFLVSSCAVNSYRGGW